MIRWLLAATTLTCAVPAQAQETSIIGLIYQAKYKPPKTRADAERILLNHPMTLGDDGRYHATIHTTDGAVTNAEYFETEATDEPAQAILILEFSGGDCEPWRSIVTRFHDLRPGMNPHPSPGSIPYMEHTAAWGSYSFHFAPGEPHCLSGFVINVNLPKAGLTPPS